MGATDPFGAILAASMQRLRLELENAAGVAT